MALQFVNDAQVDTRIVFLDYNIQMNMDIKPKE